MLTLLQPQLLEYYDKQLQDLKKTVDRVKEDYDEWQKEHNPDPKASKS